MTSLKSMVHVVLTIVLLSVVFKQAGFGQAVSGNIIGTVTDPSGAAVPQVDVAITDVDRGLRLPGIVVAVSGVHLDEFDLVFLLQFADER